jgi:hypothetical protein
MPMLKIIISQKTVGREKYLERRKTPNCFHLHTIHAKMHFHSNKTTLCLTFGLVGRRQKSSFKNYSANNVCNFAPSLLAVVIAVVVTTLLL